MGQKKGGRKIRLLFIAVSAMTSSLFHHTLLLLLYFILCLSFTLSYQAHTPTAFLKHMLPHPQSP